MQGKHPPYTHTHTQDVMHQTLTAAAAYALGEKTHMSMQMLTSCI